MRKRTVVLAVLVGMLPATAANAQTTQCSTAASDAQMRYCNAVLEAAGIVQPRVGIAASGGNPIAGASSTLGMRIGRIPRLSLDTRVTGVYLQLPAIKSAASRNEMNSLATSIDLDAAVGVFSGFTVAPTVGGFASFDVIVSAGQTRLSNDDGFVDDPATYAIGARLGVLRESFTVPGVSVTAMYRHTGDVRVGDPMQNSTEGRFELTGNSAVSVRGIVGKRLFVLGANVGLGYDKYASDLHLVVPAAATDLRNSSFKTSRVTGFANITWTLLVLNVVAEGGWQRGGDAFTAPLPSGESSRAEKSTYYASLAVRLTL